MAHLDLIMYHVGCYGDIPYNNMGNKDSHDLDIELESDGVLDIYEDVPIIAYLQTCEILVGLTPKECDWVVHRAKWFKWGRNSLLHDRIDKCGLCLAHNIVKALWGMFMMGWTILRFDL
jgi:hypothetical protein